jgi:DNA-binding IclR family transcriptional regulator
MKTVINATEALKAFGHQAEWRLSDLARELHLTVSVAHRLVRTLADAGFLEQTVERGPYVLGPELAAIARTADRHRTLNSVAHRHLVRLAARVEEAVDLCVLRGYRYITLDCVDPFHRVESVLQVGDSAGLHAGAGGKAILAYQPEAFVHEVLSAPLLRLTEHTFAEQQELLEELALIRHQGYAYSESEVTQGTCSIAAPVRDGSERVVASVSVFTSVERMNPRRTADLVAELLPVARELSKGLGSDWGAS